MRSLASQYLSAIQYRRDDGWMDRICLGTEKHTLTPLRLSAFLSVLAQKDTILRFNSHLREQPRCHSAGRNATMETTDLMPLVDQLEGDIDELEEILEPLLKQGLSATTQKMTVMDKAKLHVLITYTIESLLFCTFILHYVPRVHFDFGLHMLAYLRLQGVNAKEHPVFKELTRVKQYFTKIKDLETVSEKPTMTIDKQAVARFIKHGLVSRYPKLT